MKVTYGKGFAPVAAQTMREKVERLEADMMRLPQAECPVEHFNAPGAMARKMSIKAGVTVTGAIHKAEHLIVIAKGRLRIVTDDGTRDVEAGDVFICKSGTKNVVVALEDSAWVNFFATDITDPAELVEAMTESKASEMLGQSGNKQIMAQAAIQLGA